MNIIYKSKNKIIKYFPYHKARKYYIKKINKSADHFTGKNYGNYKKNIKKLF